MATRIDVDVLEALTLRLPPTSVSPDLTIRRVAEPVHGAPGDAAIVDTGGVRGRRRGVSLELYPRDESNQVEVRPGRVSVRGDLDTPLARATVMYAFAFALADAGVAMLHAAAVTRAGCTLLVLAPSGGGKTTTALAAHRDGWDVLTDDTVAVRLEQSTPVATGLPRRFAVPAEIASAASVPVAGDVRKRRIETIPCATGGHRVDGVVVLEHGEHGTTAASEGTQHQALRQLLDASFAVADPVSVRSVLPIVTRLATLPFWHTRLDRDPARRLAALAVGLADIQAAITSARAAAGGSTRP